MESALKQLEQNKISIKRAYKEIYKTQQKNKPKRSRFIKFKVTTNENKKIDWFLRLFFLLPIHTGMLFFITRFIAFKKTDFDLSVIKELISYKGIVIYIKSKEGGEVLIKT